MPAGGELVAGCVVVVVGPVGFVVVGAVVEVPTPVGAVEDVVVVVGVGTVGTVIVGTVGTVTVGVVTDGGVIGLGRVVVVVDGGGLRAPRGRFEVPGTAGSAGGGFPVREVARAPAGSRTATRATTAMTTAEVVRGCLRTFGRLSEPVRRFAGSCCNAPHFRATEMTDQSARRRPDSTSRLTRGVPWFCVPFSRRVCLFRLCAPASAEQTTVPTKKFDATGRSRRIVALRH